MKSFNILLLAGALVGLSAGSADASVVYTFTTVEPFAGGALSFAYEAPNFISAASFVEASSLRNATSSIQRVRFDGGCSDGGGLACDQITVFSTTGFGTLMTYRFFTDGAFGSENTHTAARGAPATLTVLQSAVPESAAWAMFISGFGLVGSVMRRRQGVNARSGVLVS